MLPSVSSSLGPELSALHADGQHRFVEPAGAIHVGGRDFEPDNAAVALLLLLRCHAREFTGGLLTAWCQETYLAGCSTSFCTRQLRISET